MMYSYADCNGYCDLAYLVERLPLGVAVHPVVVLHDVAEDPPQVANHLHDLRSRGYNRQFMV